MCMARGHRHVASAVAASPSPHVPILFGVRLLSVRAPVRANPDVHRCVRREKALAGEAHAHTLDTSAQADKSLGRAQGVWGCYPQP